MNGWTLLTVSVLMLFPADPALAFFGAGTSGSGPGSTTGQKSNTSQGVGKEGGKPLIKYPKPVPGKKQQTSIFGSPGNDKISGNGGKVAGKDEPNANPAAGCAANGC